jgi:hypothetical protein
MFFYQVSCQNRADPTGRTHRAECVKRQVNYSTRQNIFQIRVWIKRESLSLFLA